MMLSVKTNIDFFESEYKDGWRDIADTLVYTGALDEYFNYKLGKLDWRTVSFKTKVKKTPNFQGNAVINYTSHDEPYTRIIEHKHFTYGTQPDTVITREYPKTWSKGDEPYYPMNDERT